MDIDKIVQQRIEQAKHDPVIFIDRFCYTFDPRKTPPHLPFRLFPYQADLAREVRSSIENGHDLFVEKPRDMGISYTILDTLLWFWLYIPGSNFLLGSRKQDYVDNTKGSSEVSNKEESLFGKLEYTIRHLPDWLLPKGFNIDKHMTFMSLINPENGNAISGESANPNFSRAGRYKATLMDEFAFWENDNAAWGSTADTTPCRIVVTTAGNRPNTKAKRLRFGEDSEKIKVLTYPPSLDPRKTPEWFAQERTRRSEEDFAREIMMNWEVAVTGKVYPEIEKATIGRFPYNPNWGLYVSWDFGLDGMSIGWWQRNLDNGRDRLIDYYENNNKTIQFFYPLFGLPIESQHIYTQDDLRAIEELSDLPGAIHFGDPDVAKRSLLTGTSTRQELENVGIYVQTNTLSNDFGSRKEKTKVMLQKGIEINDNARTKKFVDAVKNARYPQRPDTSQAITPVRLPIHDWTSHPRTMMEYYAVNVEDVREYEEKILNPTPPAWYKAGMTYNKTGFKGGYR